ncbi:MAG TPA: hypothetical protein VF103_15435 [Polyangiaceae bacterium]
MLGLGLALARGARANGRFPNAQSVRELGADSLVVAGTYGLLLTTNGGKDFAYVCESEMFGRSAGGFTLDPLLEVAPDGSFVTGSVQAARRSLERGCGFETIESLPRNFDFFGETPPDGAESGKVVDLCRRGPGAAAPLLALVSIVDAAGIPLEHRVYEARSGTEFSRVGAPIPKEILEFGLTLDAAPSDPDRFYVTGRLANEPVLATSRDGGGSWDGTPVPVADAEDVLGVYLAAVSPSDPERIYVRASRRRLTDAGYYLWDDSLLVSDDAGGEFFEPLRHEAALLGFALGNDGETVLAGYGDPRADSATSSADEHGIYAADASVAAGDLAFERIVSDLDVNCLAATASGLYACATEVDPLGADPSVENDFHLGLYAGADLPRSRADFTALLKLRDVRGPAPRSDGRPGPCDEEWSTGDPTAPVPAGACAQFFACDNDPTALEPSALVCAGNADGEGGATSSERPPTKRDGEPGCGCRCAGSGHALGFGWTFAFLLGWWHKFGRRCRRSSF